MKIVDLSPDYVVAHGAALMEIAADVPGEYWTEANFLEALPEKWNLSFALEEGGRPVAYAVLSRKAEGHCHLHHFMVHREWRGHSVGTRMLEEIWRRARGAGLSRLTLKIAAANTRARDFYVRHGFEASERDGAYHLYEMKL